MTNDAQHFAWLEGTDPGVLDYADYRAFLPAAGFQELACTAAGLGQRPPRDHRRILTQNRALEVGEQIFGQLLQ